MGKKIAADKVILGKLFEDFWFLIPEYQRPYVWTPDNVNDLLEDLWFAFKNNSEDEYFVGSLVLKKVAESTFNEYEVLDGQQRLTTFTLLFTVVRDITKDSLLKETLNKKLFQRENPYDNIPERQRVVYKIRGNSNSFLKEFILKSVIKCCSDVSVKNMCEVIDVMKNFFKEKISEIESFSKFLLNNVVFIYVATEDREDAFRLFTILNNRGVPLSNADILKAINIGEIEKTEKKGLAEEYAKRWEDIQNALGDEFDKFLGFIRTILLKEKARKSLIEEFEEKIYKANKLKKGKDTLDFIEKFYNTYNELIDFSPGDSPLSQKPADENNAYKNLIIVMKTALPSTHWIPPLLYFYDKFGDEHLFEFLKILEFKFSSDWITSTTPAQRIENMNRILM